ncbi:hypothetical protein ACSDQ9_07530 [Aestuariimicrobium soli]|uniref:hypothetical protein n=1 Tax=Aestuariimicrobium soli TaxID=2035834 RepID=UPI003EBA8094
MSAAWLRDDDVPVLALSPHLDDLVFSAAAVVQHRPVEVWTVFAGLPDPAVTTAWDQACGFPDSTATLAARRAEDEAAFAGSRATIRHLPLLDGPYTNPARRRRDLAGLAEELRVWLTDHPDGVVLAPACAGARVASAVWERWRPRRPASTPAGDPLDPPQQDSAPLPRDIRTWGLRLVRAAMHADHQRRRAAARRRGLAVNTDHVAVRDLVLEVATDPRCPCTVVLYEDLPYLWAEPADAEVASVAQRLGLQPDLTELAVDVDDKFARIAAYRSQLDVMDPVERRLSTPGRLPGHERYWTLTRKDVA